MNTSLTTLSIPALTTDQIKQFNKKYIESFNSSKEETFFNNLPPLETTQLSSLSNKKIPELEYFSVEDLLKYNLNKKELNRLQLQERYYTTYESTKLIELGSCAFRQWRATHSHCSKLHGYQLKAKFWFGCSTLDDKNWVVDFGGLKELQSNLKHQFDHTLCVAQDDPLLQMFKTVESLGGCDLRIMDGVGIEKTAEYCFKTADSYIRKASNNRCWVNKVEVWEHEENSATAVSRKDYINTAYSSLM